MELIIRGLYVCSDAWLERLVNGPPDSAALHGLALPVANAWPTTPLLLSRLTGLTRLVVRISGNLRFVKWPSLPSLEMLHLIHDVKQECPGWGASLLAALAASPTRHSLQVLRLRGLDCESDVDATVSATAPQMTALRRLTMDGVEWTLARGTIVGRWPRLAEHEA